MWKQGTIRQGLIMATGVPFDNGKTTVRGGIPFMSANSLWSLCATLLGRLGILAPTVPPLIDPPDPRVHLVMTRGTEETQYDIVLELDGVHAPFSVDNFLTYVDAGFYDGTSMHRVIRGFMMQGGGIDQQSQRLKKALRRPVRSEATNGLRNRYGTVAMARSWRVNGATSQFFINLVHNSALDHTPQNHGYTVFGRVVHGMEAINLLADTPTTRKGRHRDRPVTPVTLVSARRIDQTAWLSLSTGSTAGRENASR
jgi:peptidyl-prolyl cis-trans isomerase A (cyclophilin A)